MTAIIEVPEYLKKKDPVKEPLEVVIEQKEKLQSTLMDAQIQLNQLNAAIERLIEENSKVNSM